MSAYNLSLVLVRFFSVLFAVLGLVSIAYVAIAFFLIANTPQDVVLQSLKPYAWHYCLLGPIELVAGILGLLTAPRFASIVSKGSGDAA